jgi:hypothetical protein
MQTFLPFADFRKSAGVLDNKRLYKQIVECKQILKAIIDPSYGWQNHPAVNMWRGHADALRYYQWVMFAEWTERRWSFPVINPDYAVYDNADECIKIMGEDFPKYLMPLWLGDERVHDSHKAMLWRKDPVHYKQFKAIAEEYDPDLKSWYYWPITKEEI